MGDIVVMPIVQVLFVCNSSPELTATQQTTAFEAMQFDCCSRDMAGFFLATPSGFVGLFEAEGDIVIDRIEQIVKARKFSKIHVIQEIQPKARICREWYVSDLDVVGVAPQSLLSSEYLAEFIGSALKPLSKRLRQ